MMLLMGTAAEFARGFGSVVDLSGRSLAPVVVPADALIDEIFGPVEVGAGDQLASTKVEGSDALHDVGGAVSDPASLNRRVLAAGSLAVTTELHQQAMDQIARVSSTAAHLLAEAPEETRPQLAGALDMIREEAIGRIVQILGVYATYLIHTAETGEGLPASEEASTASSRWSTQ